MMFQPGTLKGKILSTCLSLKFSRVLLPRACFVTTDEIKDPYKLTIQCEINRAGQTLFSGHTSLGTMKRKIEELIDFLFLANTIPAGTVLLTGTGIIQTEEAALHENDIVSITIPEIGTLRNVARKVG